VAEEILSTAPATATAGAAHPLWETATWLYGHASRLVGYWHKYRINVTAVYALLLWDVVRGGPRGTDDPRTVFLYVAYVLWMAGVYLYNKTCDVAEDSVAQPGEVLRTDEIAVTRSVSIAMLLTPAAVTYAFGESVLLTLILALVGAAYSRPFFGFRRRIKDMFMVKDLYSAVCVWAGSLALFIFATRGAQLPVSEVGLVIGLAVGVLTVELFWDIRDEAGDRAAGVETAAVRYGGENLRRALLLFQLVGFVVGLSLGDVSIAEAALLMLVAFLPANAPNWYFHLAVDIPVVMRLGALF
jgi:4-hydroxybenzoate polyprenyltransferase